MRCRAERMARSQRWLASALRDVDQFGVAVEWPIFGRRVCSIGEKFSSAQSRVLFDLEGHGQVGAAGKQAAITRPEIAATTR